MRSQCPKRSTTKQKRRAGLRFHQNLSGSSGAKPAIGTYIFRMTGRANHGWTWTRQALARFALLSVLAFAGAPAWAADTFDGARQQMVEDIKAMTTAVSAETGNKKLSPRVLDAMAAVPRHEFVPPEQKEAAYRNRPLDIGHRQTISQPVIVAIMT